MFNALKIRFNQGHQTIQDIRRASLPDKYPGFPLLTRQNCTHCQHCVDICPSAAIQTTPLAIDLGKCVFCRDCERACPEHAIRFSAFHKTATSTRNHLLVTDQLSPSAYHDRAITTSTDIKKMFGRSLKLRQVSAGGCNGCELELNACGNVNFDMGRFGVEFVASPRHADGVVLTGPISENMASALEDTWQAIPEPKLLILTGACAISGGVFAESSALKRDFLDRYPVDLFIPGCPIHPLTFINGVLDLLRQ